jgi:hypothetical protein
VRHQTLAGKLISRAQPLCGESLAFSEGDASLSRSEFAALCRIETRQWLAALYVVVRGLKLPNMNLGGESASLGSTGISATALP